MKLNLAILLLTGIIFTALIFQSINFGVKEGLFNNVNNVETKKITDVISEATKGAGVAKPIQRITKFPEPPSITKKDFDRERGIILINKNKILNYLNKVSGYISSNEIHIGGY